MSKQEQSIPVQESRSTGPDRTEHQPVQWSVEQWAQINIAAVKAEKDGPKLGWEDSTGRSAL